MSGNVSEWVGDLTSSTRCNSDRGCELRGGSAVNNSAGQLDCGDRDRLATTDSFADAGFRCCQDLID